MPFGEANLKRNKQIWQQYLLYSTNLVFSYKNKRGHL